MHASASPLTTHSSRHRYGCVVTWGLSENQERRLLDSVTRDHAHEPLPDDEVEFDDFGYVDGVGQKLSLLKDTIKLSSRETREKLAISFALAQSAKLGVRAAQFGAILCAIL